MDPIELDGQTRVLGASQGYRPLPVRDGLFVDEAGSASVPCMTTHWRPSAEELAALAAGAPVVINILGTSHPPILVETGSGPQSPAAKEDLGDGRWADVDPDTIARATLNAAAWDVLTERRRQVEQEGFTPEEDDLYGESFALAKAAGCFALAAGAGNHTADRVVRQFWPSTWDPKWWKRTTPRRDLVKAAALLLAEIERIDRAEAAAQAEADAADA